MAELYTRSAAKKRRILQFAVEKVSQIGAKGGGVTAPTAQQGPGE
jgi:hypothetical protein